MSHRMWLVLSCCLLSLALVSLAAAPCVLAAGKGDYELEGITVTARGVEAPASLTPGGVGVVDVQEIQVAQPVSVTDVIDRLAGVSRTDDSPWGADVNIRGLGRDAVVILVDGCRMNVTTDINGRLGLVNPEDVARVEVLKGPISSLYGSGSTGGVVNIITKQGTFSKEGKWSGELSAGGATNPLGADTYMNLSYGAANAWLHASGGWREHAGYDDGGGSPVANSQYRDFYGKISGAAKWDDRQTTHFMYQASTGEDVGIPGTGTAPLPGNAEVSLRRNSGRLVEVDHTIRPESDVFTQSTLKVYYQMIERNPRIDSFTSGAVAWIEPAADHETLAGDWRNIFALGGHRLVAGVDVSNWYMTSSRIRRTTAGASLSDKPTPDTRQFTTGVYAEDDWELSADWILNYGARLDHVSVTNQEAGANAAGTHRTTAWNAHAGLTRVLNPDWTATAVAAGSYRAPNILELFKNISLGGGVTETGNPDLDPERSQFFELGLHRVGGPVRLDAAVYANLIDDMITSKMVTATSYRMDSVSEAEIFGAELSLAWDIASGWQAYGNAAYTHGRDKTAGEPLPFMPPINGLVGVRQDLASGFWWLAENQWALGQYDVPSGALKSDAWNSVNLRCGYAFHQAGLKHEITLGVTNLLNERYLNYLSTSRGIELRQPGISAVAGWRVSF
ncbi:MAG: TonB-dependent receptor plug domain-containing protein [Desulfovibrionaceae bacterium]